MLITTRLGRLNVTRSGSGSARPTVLWPSMFVDGRSWDATLPLLAADDPERDLVVIDPPGLGLSDPLRQPSSIAEAADAAADLLGELALGPVDWVGNAFGGHVGYELATRPGVLRSLVAISSPTQPIPEEQRRQILLLKPLLRALGPVGPVRRAVIEAMLTDASAAHPQTVRTVTDSLARPSRRSLSLALESFILRRVDVSEKLADMHLPALFVASDDRGDWSPADAERSAAAAPNARAVTITGARTLIPLEQPAELARELDVFWRGMRE
jgi:pimeloyl-ACP methyl ester carboxylesterase